MQGSYPMAGQCTFYEFETQMKIKLIAVGLLPFANHPLV
jgi:hypothetical protein